MAGLKIARVLLLATGGRGKAFLEPIKITPAKHSLSSLRQISSNMSLVDSVDSTTNGNKTQTNGKESPEAKKQKIMPTEEAILEYAKLSENAYAPTRGSKKAAGYDLYSAVDVVVPARGKEKVPTDIQIAVPEGCYGRIAPRSGLAANHFIDVGAGVVDQDYRGNVKVILFNFAEKDFTVNKGDRIAQLLLEKICIPTLVERESLDVTERGDGGFGSTGVKAN